MNLSDPRVNIGDIVSQMLLLEGHLAAADRRCAECITKHLLTIRALAEEGVQLDTTGQYFWLEHVAYVAWLMLNSFWMGVSPFVILQGIRLMRKRMMPHCVQFCLESFRQLSA